MCTSPWVDRATVALSTAAVELRAMDERQGERSVGISMTQADLRGQRFEDRYFERCDLTRADLRGAYLLRCTFVECDLSMVELSGASIQEVVFTGCRMLGLDLSVCKPMLFSARFTACRLDHALLSGPSMRGQRFERCSLQGADFSGAELRGAVFAHCDLHDAVFDRCDLRDADLTTAAGFRIDLAGNRLTGARFSPAGAMALLAQHGVVVE